MPPGDMTYRELIDHMHGRAMMLWDHTASLLCLQANVNRDPKSRPIPVEDFHPLRKPKPRGIKRGDVAGMKSLVTSLRSAMGGR